LSQTIIGWYVVNSGQDLVRASLWNLFSFLAAKRGILSLTLNAVAVVNVSGRLKGVGIPIMMALYHRSFIHMGHTDVPLYGSLSTPRTKFPRSSHRVLLHTESRQITLAKFNEDEILGP